MITRFYVDNYKCLQNFEYKPKPFELVLGANGTGKSTIFEALGKVKEFISGERKVQDVFPSGSKTRWDSRPDQTFELEIETGTRTLIYKLVVTHANNTTSVKTENFEIGGIGFIESQSKAPSNALDVNVIGSVAYREAKVSYAGEEQTFPLSNADYTALSLNPGISLRLYFQQLFIVRINPSLMEKEVQEANIGLSNSLSNFASYYLHLLQEKQGRIFDLTFALRNVINGFDSFALRDQGKEQRQLSVTVNEPKANTRYSFSELSDGQRALIGLYTLVFCTLEKGVTLVIDEPENYIALRELQPWLLSLQEQLEEKGGQVILISHHPEFINMLAPEQGVIFERDAGGPVRIKPWNQGDSPLDPAEIMARGWES